MIPGKRYSFGDYLRMMWRRKWPIAVAFVLVNMTAAVVASTLVRPEIYPVGLAGSLAVGLVLVAILEYRDTTLRSDDDVVSSLALPVLAVVPAMLTTQERLSRHRRRLARSLAVVTAVIASAAAAAWVVFR